MLESVLLTDNGCDRATAYHMSSKIVRAGDGLFVTWLDNEYRAVFAELDPLTLAVRHQTPLHQGIDNHCGATLLVDDAGRMHAVCGAHATAGFIHRWTDTPADPGSWSLAESVGRSATYPAMIQATDGTLLLAHRYTDAHGKWGTNVQQRKPDQHWGWPIMLVQAPATGYHYPTTGLARGADGTCHLLVEFYKTYPNNCVPAHSMAVTHLYSPNDGLNWYHDDGRRIEHVPVGIEDCYLIEHDPAGDLRPGNIAVLGDGRMVCGITNAQSGTALVWLRDGDGDWRSLDLAAAAEAMLPRWRFTSQLRVAIDAQGRIVVTTTMAPKLEWSHGDNVVVCFWVAPDSFSVVRADRVAKVTEGRANWLCTIEHGHIGNARQPLLVLYTDGNRGQGCANDAICEVRAVALV